MMDTLRDSFTDEEQKWFLANFFVDMNFDSTQDFVIDLENVFKMIGFANKGNAKRTLENNFIENEDYKIVLLPREKNSKGGRPDEKILLNSETFKNMCMLVKTDEGKKLEK